MSFAIKNITGTLVSFSLILIFYLVRLFSLVSNDAFTRENLVHLWIIVIVASIVVTIITMILTHIITTAAVAIKTREEPDIDETEDERDKTIELKGSALAHKIHTIAVFFAMLTFALGKAPEVMFSMLIAFGLIAQVIEDTVRLYYYRKGF